MCAKKSFKGWRQVRFSGQRWNIDRNISTKKKILVRRDPPKRTFGDPEHAIPIIVILYRLITKFNQ